VESERAALSRPFPPTEVVCGGESLWLLPGKAAYWEREGVLLVADLHLGKAAAFRSGGVAVPEGDVAADLQRLGALVDETAAGEVVVLGDLLHARSGRGREVGDAFTAWRAERVGLRITLVMGNHDHSAGPPPGDWGIEVWPESVVRGPFRLAHEAAPGTGGFVIGGHVHPAVAVSESRRGGMRLPCFLVADSHAILPAFGSFTGTHVLGNEVAGRVFAIADGRIFEIPAALRGGGPPNRRRVRNFPEAEKSG